MVVEFHGDCVCGPQGMPVLFHRRMVRWLYLVCRDSSRMFGLAKVVRAAARVKRRWCSSNGMRTDYLGRSSWCVDSTVSTDDRAKRLVEHGVYAAIVEREGTVER
jgi:hypothetical protein